MKDIRKSMLYSNRLNKKTNSMNKTMNENLNNQFEIYLKNKYGKYNTLEQTYKIANEYSKMEFYDKDFLQRMDNYSSKKRLQEAKIKELLNKQKPTLPEEKLIKTFNRLIEDSNRRNEEKIKKSKITSDDILMNDIEKHFKKSKSHKQIKTNKQWSQIYDERFKEKLNIYKNNLKIKKKESELKNKIKEEKELNEMKKYNKKVIMTQEQINKLNFRLYYKPISKQILSNQSLLEKKKYNKEKDLFNKTLRNNKFSRTSFSSKKMSKSNSKINNFNTPSIDAEKVIDNFFYDK
jgi:hypothetical protein